MTTTAERMLHRIDLRVVRRLDGLHPGDYRTFMLGSGVDFADLREYQPHDDVRHIDWNVTARMAAPFVREYIADRDATAWLLLDRSASMRFGSGPTAKAEAVADFVTVVARLLTLRGNRVGVALFDQGVHKVIEPAGGRRQVLRIVHELLRSTDEEPPGPVSRRPWRRRSEKRTTTHGRTNLATALSSAARSVRRRSVILVLSDFISEPGWERPLGILAQRHEVVCVRFVDPAEQDLERGGVLVFEDLETGEQLTVDTTDPAFRSRYAELARARDEELRRSVQRAGLDLHTVTAGEDLVGALVRIAEQRRH